MSSEQEQRQEIIKKYHHLVKPLMPTVEKITTRQDWEAWKWAYREDSNMFTTSELERGLKAVKSFVTHAVWESEIDDKGRHTH